MEILESRHCKRGMRVWRECGVEAACVVLHFSLSMVATVSASVFYIRTVFYRI